MPFVNGPWGTSPPACNPVIDQQQLDKDTGGGAIYDTFLVGQSWKSGTDQEGKYLYSITINSALAGSSGIWTMRIGDQLDMSAIFIAEATFEQDGTITGDIEFILPTPRPQIQANKQYYYAVKNSVTSYAGRGGMQAAGSNEYADGVRLIDDSGTFNMTEEVGTAYDMYFIIKTCEVES